MFGTGDGQLSKLATRLGKWNGPPPSEPRPPVITRELARARINELGVDRAMYAGTPKFSPLRPKLQSVAELSGGPNPPIRTVRNLLETKALSAADTADTRVMFLQHDADPVGLFHPNLLWERPAWLGSAATRGEGISKQQRWIPVVTGIQTGMDQQMAQYFKQGVLEAKGHDYRSEVSYVMRRAFDSADVTDTQVSRIREWNRQLEEIHAAHQALTAAEKAAAGAA
jgi:uncharacterized membrane protein